MSTRTFGNALRELRRGAKMSQRELANRIGIDFSYISKMENERLPPPSADTIVEICRVLDAKPEEILALTGKIPTGVQKTLSSSRAAQEFLREVQGMELTDDEWKIMVKSLQELRKYNRDE